METTICKVGDAVGVIFPEELQAKVGKRYKIVRMGDTFVMTPVVDGLFSNEADWAEFPDSIRAEDGEWDEVCE